MRGPLLDVCPRSWAQSLISERYRGECWGLGGYSRIHKKFDFYWLVRAWRCETPLEELSSFPQYLERD